MRKEMVAAISGVVGGLLLNLSALAQDPVPSHESLRDVYPEKQNYSPYAGRNFPTRVFWGETHLHTGMSMDARARLHLADLVHAVTVAVQVATTLRSP